MDTRSSFVRVAKNKIELTLHVMLYVKLSLVTIVLAAALKSLEN